MMMTYDIDLILGEESSWPRAKKTFRRRYYVLDLQGKVLQEIKGAKPSTW